jgi:hypothetical protein
MTKIICVSGPSNSGKTNSIRLFLEKRGIFHQKRTGDLTAVIPIMKDKKTYVLGISSGGDSLDIVKANLLFLKRHSCEVFVCASRSRGTTIRYITNFARDMGIKLVMIPTKRVGRSFVSSFTNRTANQIEHNIP